MKQIVVILSEGSAPADRDCLVAAASHISELEQQVSGHVYWDGDASGRRAFELLCKDLSLVTEKVGIAPAVAMLLSTEQDDYRRQAALRALVEYKHYQLADLVALSLAIKFIPDNSEHTTDAYRNWLFPSDARRRLAELFVSVAGIGTLPKEGPLAIGSVERDATLWMQKAVELALSTEKAPDRRSILNICILVISQHQ